MWSGYRYLFLGNQQLIRMETICQSNFVEIPLPQQFEIEIPDKTVNELFLKGKFLETVLLTAQEIPKCINDPLTALNHWYLRIMSLLHLKLGANVVKEVNSNLHPLSTTEFRECIITTTDLQTIVWKIELATVPIKANGINNKAIFYYYQLAFDAKSKGVISNDSDTTTTENNTTNIEGREKSSSNWLDLLELAEYYILSALIVLKDYDSAINLLLTEPKDTHLELCALISLNVGNFLQFDSFKSRIQDSEILSRLENLVNSDSGIADVFGGNIERGMHRLESSVLKPNENGNISPVKLRNLMVLHKLFKFDTEFKPRMASEFQKLAPVGIQNIDLINAFI